MKKRFVSLLVVVCMLLTLFPVSAFADNAKSGEFHTDGIKTQDGNFVYSVNDDDTATLVQYIGSEDVLAANNYEVDIPAEFDGHSLSKIGQAAFAAEYHSNFKYWNATCGKIQKVKIPESVTYICSGAFYHCESLKSVNIPENVEKIEWWGFANCTGLNDITFEGNSKITTIEMECFSNCSSLERIDLPEGITDIRWGAFENCTSLMNVVIPSNTERIYRKAFYNCALGTVTFPASLKGIEVAAFGRPISLTKVYYAGTADQWNALVSAPFVPLDGKTDGTSKNFTGINYKEDSHGGNNEQLRQDGLVIIPCKMDVTTSKSDYLVNTPVDVNIAIAPGTDMNKILNGSVAFTYGDEVEKVELNGKELTEKEYTVQKLAQMMKLTSRSSDIKATLNVTYKKTGSYTFGIAVNDSNDETICNADAKVVVGEEAAELTPATKLYTLTVKNADVTIKNGDEEIKADGSNAKEGNGGYGLWKACSGPQAYYWGGTWICGAIDSDNQDIVADIMKVMTCNKDVAKAITEGEQDYTNNKAAIKELIDGGYTNAFLGGQDHLALLTEAADKISLENKLSAYDQGCNEKFQGAMKDYFLGTVDSYEAALENFKKNITDLYGNLTCDF